MSLRIQHRLIADKTASTADPDALQWRTCLREITFLDPDGHGEDSTDELEGSEAYALLLEIICGLQSPLAGETQVLGQFRAFLSTIRNADDRLMAATGDRLVQDARQVRERYLRGVGAGSYGREARRRLHGCRVIAMIGQGSLASDVRPYLADCGRLEYWTRQDFAGPSRRPVSHDAAGIVVAAPVTNGAIEQVAAHYPDLRHVLDLRAADEREPLRLPSVATLDDLFASLRESTAVSAAQIRSARALIRELAAAFESRPHVRPFGWEDLCA